jgi:hypothetical protein
VSFDASFLGVLLYVGPDLILPLTSAFAAIVGVLLMFWQRVTGAVGAVWNMLFQRNKEPHA